MYWLFNKLTNTDKNFIRKNNTFYNKVYDGRLISSAHNGQYLFLNDIPRNGKNMNVTYNSDTTRYIYKSLNDIKDGDIVYYNSKDLFVPFNYINYNGCNKYNKYTYIDPMENEKPYYVIVPSNEKIKLSFLKDRYRHVEDLTSRQIALRNQNQFFSNVIK
jgi:hypothetical protein